MADPNLELSGGGGGGSGLDLLALLAFFLQSFLLFFGQNKGGGTRGSQAPPLDPPLAFY